MATRVKRTSLKSNINFWMKNINPLFKPSIYIYYDRDFCNEILIDKKIIL